MTKKDTKTNIKKINQQEIHTKNIIKQLDNINKSIQKITNNINLLNKEITKTITIYNNNYNKYTENSIIRKEINHIADNPLNKNHKTKYNFTNKSKYNKIR